MRLLGKPRFVTKRTVPERRAQRKSWSLSDLAVSPQTRARYMSALALLLPVLEATPSIGLLDYAVTNWVESMWNKGAPLYQVSDALCGLHFFEPWSKGHLNNSWKLFSVWRRAEIPSRAPPLTSRLVYSLAVYCIAHHDVCMAALFLLGFFGLLRTGELLKLRACDLLISGTRVIVRLEHTKTGQRKGLTEVVHVQDMFTVEVLRCLYQLRQDSQCLEAPLWRYNGSAFRNRFNFYCAKFFLQKYAFRPYSLRRGGATHYFQTTRSMEATLVMGRWESQKSARIYISDGLSFLPGMTFSEPTLAMLKRYPPP